MSNGLSIFSSSWIAFVGLSISSRSGNIRCRPSPVAPSLTRIQLANVLQRPIVQHPPSRIENHSVVPTTATDILHLMDSLQLPISADMYATLLKECTKSGDAAQGSKVHSHMTNHIDLRSDLLMLNRLLLMYVSCGHLYTACSLFNGMIVRDSTSWAVMIAGHADHCDHQNVLRLFAEMREVIEVNPIPLVLVCVFKACVHSENIRFGEQVHGWFLKKTSKLEKRKDMPVVASLINLYAKCGCLDRARRVFDEMGQHCGGTAPWNIMIAGYSRQDNFKEVLNMFQDMRRAGKKWNRFTFPSVFRVCGRLGHNGLEGRQVHAVAFKVGVDSSMFVQCSLVDMYGKCRLYKEARKALEMTVSAPLCKGDDTSYCRTICWNAMLTAYTSEGLSTEAIKLLYEMKAAGLEPQESMLYHVRTACGS